VKIPHIKELFISLKITCLSSCEYEYYLESDRVLQRMFGNIATKHMELILTYYKTRVLFEVPSRYI
jgi:hypothetical protein